MPGRDWQWLVDTACSIALQQRSLERNTAVTYFWDLSNWHRVELGSGGWDQCLNSGYLREGLVISGKLRGGLGFLLGR